MYSYYRYLQEGKVHGNSDPVHR